VFVTNWGTGTTYMLTRRCICWDQWRVSLASRSQAYSASHISAPLGWHGVRNMHVVHSLFQLDKLIVGIWQLCIFWSTFLLLDFVHRWLIIKTHSWRWAEPACKMLSFNYKLTTDKVLPPKKKRKVLWKLVMAEHGTEVGHHTELKRHAIILFTWAI
jgi:hypothetical protein